MQSSWNFVSPTGPLQWISNNDQVYSPEILQRCCPSLLQKAIDHLDGARIVSVTVNNSGRHVEPAGEAMPANIEAIDAHRPGHGDLAETGLPEFCDVRVEQSVGGHVVLTTVWVPLAWNGRFFGVGGQGNRTSAPWIYPSGVRIATLPRALRNGFAAAETDAGNRDPRFADWGVAESGELDWELICNWVHRSTHDMTLIGKAVTAAIHGKPPTYSYFQGTSGGGRQALMQVQRYPGDYDGVWASDPAINWSRMIPSTLWPAVVMKELGVVTPAKLRLFRRAAVVSAGSAACRDGFISVREPALPDPHGLVGAQTEDGEITAGDALVMQKIWEGPRAPAGEFLWFGLRPGAESWGDNLFGSGVAMSTRINGDFVPIPFEIGRAYGAWVFRDPKWDWRKLTLDNFHEMVAISVRDFSELDTDDPDLSGLRESGGKLLLTHGLDDEVIPSAGTLQYYRKVLDEMGGLAETSSFVRLFQAPGEGHSHVTAAGPGLTLARGMAALMEWVEQQRAPDQVLGERYDVATGRLTMSRPVCAYPGRAQYSGAGDPCVADNFTCAEETPSSLDSI